MKSLQKLIYSDKYLVDIGAHVFPTQKYKLIYERLKREGIFDDKNFIKPKPASDEEILLVHSKDYLKKLENGSLSEDEILKLELPFSKELVEASLICAKGSILTCEYAMEDGACVHLGGGFHHAFPDHGEGFCVFNDIAIGIRSVQKIGLVKKALVIDCDLHQGNGTAFIFSNDKSVFTFSIHQYNNYPTIKPPGDMDINLEDGCGEGEYLAHLKYNLPKIIADFSPGLIVYVAGADPYEKDQLGGLSLTMEGLRQRDRVIFDLAMSSSIPVAAVLAGGYAIDLEDTVQIHYNMIMELKEGLSKKAR